MFRNRAFRTFLVLLAFCSLLAVTGWPATALIPIIGAVAWRWTDRRFALAMLLLLVLSLLCFAWRAHRQAELDHHVQSPVTLTGIVIAVHPEDRYLSGQVALGFLKDYQGRLLRLGGMPFTVSGRTGADAIRFGSIIQVTGTLRLRRVYRNPGSDRTRFYRARGLRYSVAAPDPAMVRTRHPGLSVMASPYDRLSPALAPLHLALLKAMTRGDRDALPILFREKSRRLGIYHLFVVSGFHFGLFFAAVVGLLFLLPVRNRWRKRIALLVITGMLPVTGFSPPAVRAWLMIATYLLFNRRDIQVPPLDAVGLAGILLLLFQPGYAMDPGFLFSFLVTGGIVSMIGTDDRWWQVFLKIPFAAFLFALPVSILWFHRVALMGPVTNLLITVPVLAQIYLFLGTLLHLPVAAPLDWLLGGTIRFLGHLPGPAPTFGLPAWLAPAAFLPAAAWWFLPRHRARWIGLIGGSLLLLLSGRVSWPLPDGLYIPDTGQSQAVLVRVQGYNWLIDAGGEWEARLGLIPWLNQLGIHRLDGVFLSHFDSDHAGGLPELMDHLPVGRLYLPYLDGSRNACRVLSRSDAIPVPRTLLNRAATPTLRLPGITVTVLHPASPPATVERANDASLVMAWDVGGIRLLLPGDLDGKELVRLLPDLPTADVLIAPHHGSRKAAIPGLRDTVRPGIVIVCCGRNNRFHFPSSAFLKQMAGIPVFTTGEAGELRLYLNEPGSVHTYP